VAERENTNKKPPAKIYGTGGKLEFEIREGNGVLPSFESLDFLAEELPVDFFLSSESSVLSAKRSSTSRGLWAIVSSSRARAVVWKRESWIIRNLLAKVGRRGEWTRAMMALVVEEGVENAVDCAAEQHTGGSSAGTQLEIMGRELKCAIW
jgi:hypothetical protein